MANKSKIHSSKTLFCFMAALSAASCSSSPKKPDAIAEPVRTGVNEFVLRKPLNLRCNAAKEFITAMQYLRGESDLALGSDEATRLAHDISSGCNGAAKRFIVNTDMLRQSGMDARSAVKIGVKLAASDETTSSAFTKIFRLAFEKYHLDLDFGAAVRLAQSMTLDFNGDPAIAAKDFEDIVSFCRARSGLDLSKPQCGELAGRIATLAGDQRENLGSMFIDTFKFLTGRDGPALTAKDALKVAEALTSAGPRALENFSEVYDYAIAEKGLKLSRSEAVNLAAKVAAHSRNQPAVATKFQAAFSR